MKGVRKSGASGSQLNSVVFMTQCSHNVCWAKLTIKQRLVHSSVPYIEDHNPI